MFLLVQLTYKPQNIQFIFKSSGFLRQARQLVVTVLNLDQLLLQLLTVNPVVVLCGLQSTKSKEIFEHSGLELRRGAIPAPGRGRDRSPPEVLLLQQLQLLLQLVVLSPRQRAGVVKRVQLIGPVGQDVVLGK